MKFTVRRSKWVRGGRGGNSCLLNERNNKCCLGFVGRQCGIPAKVLSCRGTPATTSHDPAIRNKWPLWLLSSNDEDESSEASINAMAINDNTKITDKVREVKLKELFAKHGDKIVFIP